MSASEKTKLALCVDWDVVDRHMEKVAKSKTRIRIDPDCLRWKPLVSHIPNPYQESEENQAVNKPCVDATSIEKEEEKVESAPTTDTVKHTNITKRSKKQTGENSETQSSVLEEPPKREKRKRKFSETQSIVETPNRSEKLNSPIKRRVVSVYSRLKEQEEKKSGLQEQDSLQSRVIEDQQQILKSVKKASRNKKVSYSSEVVFPKNNNDEGELSLKRSSRSHSKEIKRDEKAVPKSQTVSKSVVALKPSEKLVIRKRKKGKSKTSKKKWQKYKKKEIKMPELTPETESTLKRRDSIHVAPSLSPAPEKSEVFEENPKERKEELRSSSRLRKSVLTNTCKPVRSTRKTGQALPPVLVNTQSEDSDESNLPLSMSLMQNAEKQKDEEEAEKDFPKVEKENTDCDNAQEDFNSNMDNNTNDNNTNISDCSSNNSNEFSNSNSNNNNNSNYNNKNEESELDDAIDKEVEEILDPIEKNGSNKETQLPKPDGNNEELKQDPKNTDESISEETKNLNAEIMAVVSVEKVVLPEPEGKEAETMSTIVDTVEELKERVVKSPTISGEVEVLQSVKDGKMIQEEVTLEEKESNEEVEEVKERRSSFSKNGTTAIEPRDIKVKAEEKEHSEGCHKQEEFDRDNNRDESDPEPSKDQKRSRSDSKHCSASNQNDQLTEDSKQTPDNSNLQKVKEGECKNTLIEESISKNEREPEKRGNEKTSPTIVIVDDQEKNSGKLDNSNDSSHLLQNRMEDEKPKSCEVVEVPTTPPCVKRTPPTPSQPDIPSMGVYTPDSTTNSVHSLHGYGQCDLDVSQLGLESPTSISSNDLNPESVRPPSVASHATPHHQPFECTQQMVSHQHLSVPASSPQHQHAIQMAQYMQAHLHHSNKPPKHRSRSSQHQHKQQPSAQQRGASPQQRRAPSPLLQVCVRILFMVSN